MATINKNEQAVLFQEKIRAGKSISQANSEVVRDIEFQKKLGYNYKLMKTELLYLRKQNIKLKDKIEKLERRLKEVMLRELNIKEHKIINGDASIKHCSRVLTYLQEFPNLKKDKIRKGCQLDTNCYKIVLNFLERNKLIAKNDNGEYSLAEKCI